MAAALAMANSSRNSARINRSKRATTLLWISNALSIGSAKGPSQAIRSPVSLKKPAGKLTSSPLPLRQLELFPAMEAFLEYVVKGLVDHPEEVTITPVEREGTTV